MSALLTQEWNKFKKHQIYTGKPLEDQGRGWHDLIYIFRRQLWLLFGECTSGEHKQMRKYVYWIAAAMVQTRDDGVCTK